MPYNIRQIHSLVCTVMLLLFCYEEASGQNNTLTVGNGSGPPGSVNNVVPVSLANQNTIAGLMFTVNYDPNMLTPFNVTTVNRTQNQSGLDFSIPTVGQMRITLFDFDGNNLDPSSGEIIQIIFDVSNTATQSQLPITITDEAISSPSYQPVSVTVENGTFDVTGGQALTPPLNLTAQEVDNEQVVLTWSPPSTTTPMGKIGNDLGATTLRYGNSRFDKSEKYLNKKDKRKKSSKSKEPVKKTQNTQPEELFNGVSVTRTVGENQIHEFFINVPEDANATTLKFKTSNSIGDPDLFVSFGLPPDLANDIYDFVSDNFAPEEELIIVTPNSDPSLQPGNWFVTILGFVQSTYTLTATFSQPRALMNGVPVTKTVEEFDIQEFFIAVPTDATTLTVETSNSTGDPDLFVRFGSPPDLDNFILDFSSETIGPSEESITVDQTTNPPIQAGNWFVSVQEFEFGQQTYTLTATHNGTGGPGNSDPVLNTIGNKTSTVGQLLQFTVSATDPDSDPITLSATNLPTGANFTDNGNGTGTFSWTPTANQVGTFQVTFTVSDNRGGTDSVTIQITVHDVGGLHLLGYNVYRSTTQKARNTGILVGNVHADTTTFTGSVQNLGTFFYQVTAVYNQGESFPSNDATILVTSIEEGEPAKIPVEFTLRQNYPNPFNPTTKIRFDVPSSSQVNISIFNLLGQKIRVLVDRPFEAGEHTITWDGRDDQGQVVSSGIYIYRIRAGTFIHSRKMVFLR